MADNPFASALDALFSGMDKFVTTKTVVGEAVKIDDAIILPLVDVSCGMAAGAFADKGKNKDNGAGGMSAKISPSDSKRCDQISQRKESGPAHQGFRYGSGCGEPFCGRSKGSRGGFSQSYGSRRGDCRKAIAAVNV